MKKPAGVRLGVLVNYATCVALLPFVIMLYQYQRNIQHLSLWHVLAFCGLAAIILLTLYYISKTVFKSGLSAFMFAGILFFALFMYHPLSSSADKVLRQLDISHSSISAFTSLFFAVIITYHIKRVKWIAKANKVIMKRGFTSKIATATDEFELLMKIRIPSVSLILVIVLFFLLKLIFTRLSFSVAPQGRSLIGIALMLATALAFLCRKFTDKAKSKIISSVALVMIGAMLAQNVAMIVSFASHQKANDMFYKETFMVAESAAKPNIYWVHCDGFLGFDSMGRFFGDDQEYFTQELERRGFWMNRDASFDAHQLTAKAIPALMSPYFYDRVMAWEFDPEYAEQNPLNEDLRVNPDLRIGSNKKALKAAREKNETVIAFEAAGYNTGIISWLSVNFYPTSRRFYDLNSSEPLLTPAGSVAETLSFVDNVTSLESLVDLLNSIMPSLPFMTKGIQDYRATGFTSAPVTRRMNLFTEVENAQFLPERIDKYWNSLDYLNRCADCLLDMLAVPSPRFAIINLTMAHYPFYYDEYGNYHPRDAMIVDRYPANHTFSAKTLLKFIDIILARDPDAIIVLQGDHGLQAVPLNMSLEDIASRFACTQQEAKALLNQVISAVRLPKEQITPETEQILSDPRNISRFLVNSYVGENYDYIPYQYRQVYRGPERDRN